MKEMEPTRAQARLDHAGRQAELDELSPADDTVLAFSQIDHATFTTYTVVKCTLAGHGPDGAALNAAVQPAFASG